MYMIIIYTLEHVYELTFSSIIRSSS